MTTLRFLVIDGFGIDDDVMNDDVRYLEVRNWLDHLVLPHKRD